MNEATLWAKVIFPLLALAERGMVEVFAEVNLSTQYVRFSLDGVADGILGKAIAGRLKVPYLVMVEAKRGVEGTDPVAQLYGQLLCGAHKNWQSNHQEPQELFGCFTIGQTWQFLRVEVSLFEGDRPQLYVEYSPEYTEKVEAELILKILKGIVNRYEDQKSFPERSM